MTAPITAALPDTAPDTRHTAALAACRRLMAGNASGEPAKLTADLHRAILGLAAYKTVPTPRTATPIVAERCRIHTGAATAAQLHTRAKRAHDRGTAGETPDHLSRLTRYPRGLIHDGHLDRPTPPATEGPTTTLYPCSAPRPRTCVRPQPWKSATRPRHGWPSG